MNNTKNNMEKNMTETSNQKSKSSRPSLPPTIMKKETKSKTRLFRFTPSNFGQLESLAARYGTDISKIADILIEASKEPNFENLLDSYVTENYSR